PRSFQWLAPHPPTLNEFFRLDGAMTSDVVGCGTASQSRKAAARVAQRASEAARESPLSCKQLNRQARKGPESEDDQDALP
ncbi:hypothetical protein ACWTU6_30445, partial [Mesorhizobium sp. BHbsci]